VTDPNQPPPGPSGLLVVDKDYGTTSMTVCRIVKKGLIQGGALKRIKVGQGGTLDPLATGVLVVLIGKATKLCEEIMAGAKHYDAAIDLAHTSTTDDGEGVLTPVIPRAVPNYEQIVALLPRFTGIVAQRPPIYSALQIGGRRAYHLAREGKIDELPARDVRIDALTLIDYAYPRLSLRIKCGKGVYIRSLARDLGLALGTGGMLESLRRTRVGIFDLTHAHPVRSLLRPLRQEDLTPIDHARITHTQTNPQAS
jgi:tRNA pseudouridine55 synthase